MKKVCGASLFCILFFLSPLQAQEKDIITLFGTAIPGIFDEKNPGPYNVVYNRLVAGVRADIILTMLPIRRATQVFRDRGADCLFLGSPNPDYYYARGVKATDIIHSTTIMAVALKIYSPQGKEAYEDASILHEANFAVDVGIGDVSNLGGLIPVEREGALFASTLMDGFKLLDQGRIEALVAIDFDVQALMARYPQYSKYPVSKNFVLRRTEDVFVCRKFPRTERFIADIDRRTKELKELGLFDDIFAH